MSNLIDSTTEQTVEPALVILDHDDPAATMAGVLSDPTTRDREIDVLLVIPTATYEAERRARQQAGSPHPYTLGQCVAEAERVATRTARAWVDDCEPREVAAAVGRQREYGEAALGGADYGRVYIPRPKRGGWLRRLRTFLLPRRGGARPDGLEIVSLAHDRAFEGQEAPTDPPTVGGDDRIDAHPR